MDLLRIFEEHAMELQQVFLIREEMNIALWDVPENLTQSYGYEDRKYNLELENTRLYIFTIQSSRVINKPLPNTLSHDFVII